MDKRDSQNSPGCSPKRSKAETHEIRCRLTYCPPLKHRRNKPRSPFKVISQEKIGLRNRTQRPKIRHILQPDAKSPLVCSQDSAVHAEQREVPEVGDTNALELYSAGRYFFCIEATGNVEPCQNQQETTGLHHQNEFCWD